MEKPRYEVLDGMRGIAALCVLLRHIAQYSPYSAFRNAFIAVDFFFILSGFVIAYAYGPRIGLGLADFMQRRLIRLYPMFLFGLILGAPVLILATHLGLTGYSLPAAYASLVTNVFYLPHLGSAVKADIYHDPIFPANGSAWSLFFELIANAFFILLFTARRHLWIIIILAYLGIIGSGFLVPITEGHGFFTPDSGWGLRNIYGGLPRVFYGFSLGILLQQSVGNPRFAPIRKRLERMGSAPQFLLGAAFLTFAMPKLGYLDGAYYLIVIAIVAPLLVLLGSFANCRTKTSLLICKYLGWISYPLYCVHMPVVIAMLILSAKGYGLGAVPMAVLACVLSLLVANIAAAFYDEPLRSWLTRRLADRRHKIAQAQQA